MSVEESGYLKRVFFIFTLVTAACFLLIRLLYSYLGDPARYPINTIKFIANFEHISHSQLEAILDEYHDKSFYTIPVQRLYTQLTALPWAGEVEVKRIFPDTIKIILKEKKPIATWNDAILTENGDYFVDKAALEENRHLPHLIGPPQDVKTLLQMFQKMSNILTTHNLSIQTLQRRDNQAWDATLTNGIRLKLGKQDVLERINRFNQAYPTLKEKPGQLTSVDLRYPKGMAVKWEL